MTREGGGASPEGHCLYSASFLTKLACLLPLTPLASRVQSLLARGLCAKTHKGPLLTKTHPDLCHTVVAFWATHYVWGSAGIVDVSLLIRTLRAGRGSQALA
eukprot:601014-Amphidinium_carterae.1